MINIERDLFWSQISWFLEAVGDSEDVLMMMTMYSRLAMAK